MHARLLVPASARADHPLAGPIDTRQKGPQGFALSASNSPETWANRSIFPFKSHTLAGCTIVEGKMDA
jgi:hypothetical protein